MTLQKNSAQNFGKIFPKILMAHALRGPVCLNTLSISTKEKL